MNKKIVVLSILVIGFVFFGCDDGSLNKSDNIDFTSGTLIGTSWRGTSISVNGGVQSMETRIIKFTSNSTWNYSYTIATPWNGTIDSTLSVNLNGTYIFWDNILSLKLEDRVIITTISFGNNTNSIRVDDITYYQESLFP